MMTDKLGQEQEAERKVADGSVGGISSRNNRRKLLKGVAALPVIMTLQSGAALARTSNLIGAVQDPAQAAQQVDGSGNPQLICLEPDPPSQPEAPPYDLGDMPSGHLEPNIDDNGQPISLVDQATNCQTGGGIIVSATAFASIEDRITFM